LFSKFFHSQKFLNFQLEVENQDLLKKIQQSSIQDQVSREKEKVDRRIEDETKHAG